MANLRHHSRLTIHGFASRTGDGPATFLESLACHRANKLTELAQRMRTDCTIASTVKHGPPPATDTMPATFWQSGTVETARDPTHWLDPGGALARADAALTVARGNPTQANLAAAAAQRPLLQTWLDNIATQVVPTGATFKLDRADLDDYRNQYAFAEGTWRRIDDLLTLQGHSAATTNTYAGWAAGTGTTNQGSQFHAQNVPTTARYHIDIFGEGYFAGAVNVGMATRTSTTGVSGSRVPNAIYRRFSGTAAAQNGIPIADHVADLVTAENGPIQFPGLPAEIARILAPGGMVILYNPLSSEPAHDAVAAAIPGATVTKTRTTDDSGGTIETRIVAPTPTSGSTSNPTSNPTTP